LLQLSFNFLHFSRLLLWQVRLCRSLYIFHVIALYGLAKIVETLDAQIFTWSNYVVSGHTLKHLIAALAAYRIVQMLQGRTLRTS